MQYSKEFKEEVKLALSNCATNIQNEVGRIFESGDQNDSLGEILEYCSADIPLDTIISMCEKVQITELYRLAREKLRIRELYKVWQRDYNVQLQSSTQLEPQGKSR